MTEEEKKIKKWKNRYYKERRKRKKADKAVKQIYDDYQDIGNMYFDLDEKMQQVIAVIKEYIRCLEKNNEMVLASFKNINI